MFGLFKKKKVTYEMKAVVDGAVVPMTEATDPVFSSCALGNGSGSIGHGHGKERIVKCGIMRKDFSIR